jgi:hypothetical protein
MLRPNPPEVKTCSFNSGPLPKGVTPRSASSYNVLVMPIVSDAAQPLQIASAQLASARVLAALSSVSAALSGCSAFAPAPQPLR